MIASLYGVKEILILVCSPHSSTWHEHFDYVFLKKEGILFSFFLPPLLALMADWVISVHFSLLLRGDFIYLVEGLLLAIYLFLGY